VQGPSVAERYLETIRLVPAVSSQRLDRETLEAMAPLARFGRIGSWLWHRLVESGQTELSPSMQAELKNQSRAEAAAMLKLVATTLRVFDLLSRQGIRVIPLKGVAYATLGTQFPFFRFRSSGDIDLLVEPGAAEQAWRILVEAGFQKIATPSVHPDHHHLPTLVGDFQVPVEIHSAASLFWSEALSWERLGQRTRSVTWHGCQIEVASTTELCWHALIHSLGDGAAGCRLRNFLTVAALLRDEALDWELLVTRLNEEPIREHDSRHPIPNRAVRRWFAIAAWLAGTSPPADLGSPDLPELVRLLEFRRRRLSRWPAAPEAQIRAATWLEEATRTTLGLGFRRLGHWQPKHRRPMRLIESFFYQSVCRFSAFGLRLRGL